MTGSTRMKAGTAQKLMLNMLSTAVMIRLGRVEGNRMVNMQLTNDKLVARGTRMVAEASGLDETRARELLLRYGSVKRHWSMYRSLNEYIARLEREGELVRIGAPVSPVEEIAEITDRISKTPGGGKALLFEIPARRFPC